MRHTQEIEPVATAERTAESEITRKQTAFEIRNRSRAGSAFQFRNCFRNLNLEQSVTEPECLVRAACLVIS